MMKTVQSAALPLMMMMMMMMMIVSAVPLPPSLNRHADVNTDSFQLMNITERNSTSFESRHHGNVTKEDITRNVTLNLPMDDVSMFLLTKPRCVLATCMTSNLGSSLQVGDETAGSATTDPFGIGKK